MKMSPRLGMLLLTLMLFSCGQTVVVPEAPVEADEVLAQFEAELEYLRQELKIPGMSAAVVRDQEIVWARGFGYADLNRGIEATPDTPYHLASVTKPIAATLIMQLVEEGMLDLDDPVSEYGVNLESQGTIRVWHLLTHTSEGTPGTQHKYDGNRYAMLDKVIEGASGKPLGELLNERILLPLGMENTAPNPSWGWAGFAATLGWGKSYRNQSRVYQVLARPYQFDSSYNTVPGSYSLHFSSAAGLLSSVTDLALFDIALDQDLLLRPETKEQMFAPAVPTFRGSSEFMYGLGWYAQRYGDIRLLWHAGRWPPSVSALYLKVPEENLTFIILANTDNLSTPYACLGNGDVLCSTLALAFYKAFVFPRQFGRSVPQVDWAADKQELVNQLRQVTGEDVLEILERELWSYRQLYASVGRIERANQLLTVRRQVFGESSWRLQAYVTALHMVTPQPVSTSLGVHHLVWISRVLLAWLVLTAASVAFAAGDLTRDVTAPWGIKAGFLLVTVLFGPVGLLVYLVTFRQAKRTALPPDAMPPWRRALASTVYSVTGNSVGVFLLSTVYAIFLPAGNTGLLIILVPFLVGWLVFRAPYLASQQGGRYGLALRRTLLAEVVSTNLVLAGMFPVLFLGLESWLPGIGLDSPICWGMLSLAAVAGALLAYPYNIWAARRGFVAWPIQAAPAAAPMQDGLTPATPSLRAAWWLLLLSLALLVGSFGLTMITLS